MINLLHVNYMMHAAQPFSCTVQQPVPVVQLALYPTLKRVPRATVWNCGSRNLQKANPGKLSPIVCSAAVAAEPGTTEESEVLPAPAQEKIRIKLKSYNTKLIKESCDQIVTAAKSTGARVSGPVSLPTRYSYRGLADDPAAVFESTKILCYRDEYHGLCDHVACTMYNVIACYLARANLKCFGIIGMCL